VNECWLKSHHVPDSKAEYSVSDEITERVDKQLLELLHGLHDTPNMHQHNPHTAEEHLQLLGHIWKNKTVESEESYLKLVLNNLMGSRENADIGKFLGWMVSSDIPTILSISARREMDPPYKMRANLFPGQLLLPKKYYLDPHLKKTDVWKAYEEFISICSVELGLPFLYKGIEAEEHLAKVLDKKFTFLAKSKKGSSLKHWVPGFEWDAFMNGVGLDWEKRIWTVNSIEKFKGILKWICSVKQDLLFSILSLHCIRFAAPYLRPSIKAAYHNLYYKAFFGIAKPLSQDGQMLHDIKKILPDALCHLYSKSNNVKLLSEIKDLVSTLHSSAIQYMKNSTLLSKKTSRKIIEKLHRMKFIIGNTKTGQLPHFTYVPDSFLYTICSINSARTKQIPAMTDKTYDKVHSEYPCFITNASYFEESNDIYLPWGILQAPFYYSDAPLGWNHGGLGATICHEMTHAFDLEGSLFSPTGQYKESWTRRNRSTFKRQTRKVSDFFGKFKHNGKKIDGKKTLSENWADLGGLKISLESLKNELEKRGVSKCEETEAYRMFFISYAISWRTLSRKKFMEYTMMESVHALAEDRVDRMVPHFQEWVDAFEIKEKDPLYLAPAKRLNFF
jgi:predicted metalloendopeptidase